MLDVVAFLDRQYDFLSRRATPRAFLLQLGPFIAKLQNEPRIRVHLQDLDAEARQLHQAFGEHDERTRQQLVALRNRIPRVARLDDAQSDVDEFDCHYNLTTFDAQAARGCVAFRERLFGRGAAVWRSVSDVLIEHLRHRLEVAFPRWQNHIQVDQPVGDPLRAALSPIVQEHKQARREFAVTVETAGAFALARLRLVLRQLNPRTSGPVDDDASDEDLAQVVGDPTVMRTVVYTPSESYEETALLEIDRQARALVERVYEEVRARIGSVRSHRALMDRFKQRAEAYDHEALCAIASDDTITRKEDKLADRLAAFLFDQGLTPLTRPMIGRLVPDIVAPDLYVEAKQFGDRRGAQKCIRDGAKQVWDTFNRLRGTPQEVREAYLVVFRRKGPNVMIEEGYLRAGGTTLHVLIVDVSPNKHSGSRQKESPVTVTAADLLPRPGQLAGRDAGRTPATSTRQEPSAQRQRRRSNRRGVSVSVRAR